MSTVIPFTQALRERTWAGDADLDGSRFMLDLLSGHGSRDDYIALVAQHFFVYEALEATGDRLRESAELACFLTPQLTRMPAITDDLAFLLGPGWRDRIAPLPSTRRYVARIDEIADAAWTGGFIAHHYTRYLGDLTGGSLIRTLMQRRFGFETNGVGFYLFDQIATPREFRSTYRAQLDAVDWSDVERERVIDEVVHAYRLTTELFDDLAAARVVA